ncbi:hypothetical protein IFR05_011006 [Cadophora sp. M221]|nr:hypothetical protein IFR05_011006 [Cadophora sp. M221]
MVFLSNNQTRARLPWIVALCGLFLIWSLWSLGVNLKPFTISLDDRPMDHLGSPDNNIGPIPIAKPSPPKYPAFEDQAAHSNETDYVSDRPLILYAYFETELARKNLQFYITHALHNAADFLFIFNGETNANELLPEAGNIRFIHRENKCYDLGAFAEVLTTNDLYKKYKRYITMNASIRGPFLPYWSQGCWSDMYLSKITDETKLIGMTMNCNIHNHIQSMIWAYDRTTIEILLFPSAPLVKKYKEILGPYVLDPVTPVPAMTAPGINSCPHEYWDAVAIEVYATGLIQAAGYKVDAMMFAFHSSAKYQETCQENGDVLVHERYYGMDLHPYDTVFAKTNRGIGPLVLERLTDWTDGNGYTSYDRCHI